MKKTISKIMLALLAVAFVFSFSSCSKHKGYKQDKESGLYYKFYVLNKDSVQAQTGDVVSLIYQLSLEDSILVPSVPIQELVQESIYNGDVYDAIRMMHVGDSASFYVKADSIAILYYEQDPQTVGLKAEDYFRYEVKLVEVQTEEEFQSSLEKMKESMMEASRKALAEYVAANNITVTPESSGIYIITKEQGKGRCPVKGEKVELDFSATLLNGQSVGSTFDSPEKFSFVLGEGFTIQGWEEIVPKMHLGERVKAIIPFEMAYGEHSVGSIPAYSNLIYDVKLLKITTKEELEAEAERALAALKADSQKAFDEYLSANSIVDHTPSGLYYTKSLVTDGASPQKGQKVSINFKATYLDGTLLGNTDNFEAVYGDGSLLRGLEEGIGLMHVGEKARLVLPYTLAYGEHPYGNIPGCANLIFDVELLEIK